MYQPTKEIEDAIANIKQSNFFKTFGMSRAIYIGSGFYTYPIEHFVKRREIIVNTERGGGRNFRGIHQSAFAMIKQLLKIIPICDWFLTSDCCQLRIYYNA